MEDPRYHPQTTNLPSGQRNKSPIIALLLFLTVCISYGQTLGMDVWRDAHAIFFKFNHLYERTGYLGNGILGEGAYRFSVAPYYFIYKLVGYDDIWAYYLLNFIFYFLAALSVYFLFSRLLNRASGAVAGFLFAAGYVATEGFMDLAGSMIFNVSIILLCFCLLVYFTYSQIKSFRYYLLALSLYVFAIFLTPVRVHYFIGVLFLFDLLWLPIQKIWLRLLPFSLFFYLTFLQSSDSRTASIIIYIKNILSGQIYNLYSFFGSLGFLFISDKYIHFLIQYPRLKLTELLLTLITFIFIYFFTRESQWPKIRLIASLVLSASWYFFSQRILSAPQLNPGLDASLAVYLGGLILIFLANIFICIDKYLKKYFLLLIGWLVLNLFTYSAYDPVSIVTTVDRYMAHSFVPLVGLFSLAFYKKSRLGWLIILWGIANLYNSFTYQRQILLTRSFPSKQFYSQLKSFLPDIHTGDVLYFDVADDAMSRFKAAFTVGQMPDETAIAWKYGVDRYDFRRLTEYSDLAEIVKNHTTPLNQIRTFFYDSKGLTDTTAKFQNLLKTEPLQSLLTESTHDGSDVILNISPALDGLMPIEIKFDLQAAPTDISQLKFPLVQNSALISNPVAVDPSKRQIALDYAKSVSDLRSRVQITTSSNWPENPLAFINDLNTDTAWRADRFIWAETGHAGFTIDLVRPLTIDRLVWLNAYPSHSPISYSVLLSQDGKNWQTVKTVNSVSRLNSGELQIETFSPQLIRYLKMDITRTLSDDSPGVSETWVVPSIYSTLDLPAAEQFLANPLGYVPIPQEFTQTLKLLNNNGLVKLSWWDNHSNKWSTTPDLSVPVLFDNQIHPYSLTFPVKGSQVTAIKISTSQIPGKLTVTRLYFRHVLP